MVSRSSSLAEIETLIAIMLPPLPHPTTLRTIAAISEGRVAGSAPYWPGFDPRIDTRYRTLISRSGHCRALCKTRKAVGTMVMRTK